MEGRDCAFGFLLFYTLLESDLSIATLEVQFSFRDLLLPKVATAFTEGSTSPPTGSHGLGGIILSV